MTFSAQSVIELNPILLSNVWPQNPALLPSAQGCWIDRRAGPVIHRGRGSGLKIDYSNYKIKKKEKDA